MACGSSRAAQRAAARIVGAGMTALTSGRGQQQHVDAVQLMVDALAGAVADAGMQLSDLDTVIALPSLMSEQHFMMAHAVAQAANLTPRKGLLLRTLDVGGAGPVAALLAAKHEIEHQGRRAVAIVAGDTVASVPLADFLARADASCSMAWSHRQHQHQHPHNSSSSSEQYVRQQESAGAAAAAGGPVPSPCIPNLYDRVARWHMQQYGTTREQLAMCASLMTYQASHHPAALHRKPRLVQEVLSSPLVAPVTTKLECAKLADGAAALVLVPAAAAAAGVHSSRAVAVLGGGEASGPLNPPQQLSEECFSAAEAAAAAYAAAGLAPRDIHYWGLYDCFPICLLRAIEAVGLATNGGRYIQEQYSRLLAPLEQQQQGADVSTPAAREAAADVWPVNTHGGLLGSGAPWEVPAMYSLIEAVAQLRGEAAGRQVHGAQTALVYGNGGIFSASAVAILGTCRDTTISSRL